MVKVYLIFPDQMRSQETIHARILAPNLRGDPPQTKNVREYQVSDHGPPDPQVLLPLLLLGDAGLEQRGHLVGPGQLHVLLPPSTLIAMLYSLFSGEMKQR